VLLSRKKQKTAASSKLPAFNPRAEAARRLLLVLVTALVVARPLVLGEDPGLLYPLSGTSGLTLSMLWLVAAAAWAAWQAWFGRGDWHLGPIELGLAGVAALVFATAGAAHYRHPALLISWEWGILVLVFFLVRQLFRTEADVRGLLAVIMATGVSLSAYAAFQHFIELPRTRALFASPDQLREELAKINVFLDANDPHLDVWRQRVQMDHVFATYAHPNAFAGYLALLAPAAICWSGIAVRRSGWGWRAAALALCTCLLLAALWWTHSRGAILGVLLAGAAMLVVYGKKLWWPWRAWLVAALGAAAALLLAISRIPPAASALEKATHSFGLRTEYWAATRPMIADHPWLGVGAGNFGRLYPRYMAATASEKIQDPHNFVLEIWATAGIGTMLVFLVALGLLFYGWARTLSEDGSQTKDPRAGPAFADAAPFSPWPFLLGGAAGLALDWLLRAGYPATADLLQATQHWAGRAVVWFAAFALFQGVPWPGRARPIALMTGVLALFLNLCVSGGIAWPSVAQPLWIVAALALAGDRDLAAVGALLTGRLLPARGAAFAILAGLALAYFWLVLSPVTAASTALAEADTAARQWRRWTDRIKTGSASENGQAHHQALDFLNTAIARPLETAQKEDPGAVTPHLELAHWYGEAAPLLRDGRVFDKALAQARLAQKLDPDSKEGYQAEYHLLKDRAEGSGGDPGFVKRLPAVFHAIVERDPTEAALHYELAELYQNAEEPARGKLEAQRALELDRLATTPARQLTAAQRAKLEERVAAGQ
jgi:hypothetical protein